MGTGEPGPAQTCRRPAMLPLNGSVTEKMAFASLGTTLSVTLEDVLD